LKNKALHNWENFMMKKMTLAILAAASLALSGCASMDRQTTGMVGGAVVGGLLGDAVVGGPLGTLGGAAAGAYIGNRVTDPNRR
jgi:osmotically inducible lipoprotein OsmB